MDGSYVDGVSISGNEKIVAVVVGGGEKKKKGGVSRDRQGRCGQDGFLVPETLLEIAS